jgi:RNA polymerase subunit RPABC4/transcription elongation factor Spt4
MKNVALFAAIAFVAISQPVNAADNKGEAACTACNQTLLQETNYCPSPVSKSKTVRSLKPWLGKPTVLNLSAAPIVLSCPRSTVGL